MELQNHQDVQPDEVNSEDEMDAVISAYEELEEDVQALIQEYWSLSGQNGDLEFPEVLNTTAHEPGNGVVDTGCNKGVIGEEILAQHKQEMLKAGLKVNVLKQERTTTFKFGNQETLSSIYSVEMQCRVGGRMLLLRLCVVPGWTPLLASKPMLKALGAILDMERDEIRFTRINVAVPLKVAASGHYQLNLCEMKNGENKKIQTAEVD
eukprot:8520914-Pyramimonas_sp.AAC.1